jgi:hypothetical protein
MNKSSIITIAVIFTIIFSGSVYAVSPRPELETNQSAAENIGKKQVSFEQARKFAQYCKDTLPVRKKMLELETDILMLKTEQKPDWAIVSEKQKEIADSMVELQKKAFDADIHTNGLYPWSDCMTDPGRK